MKKCLLFILVLFLGASMVSAQNFYSERDKEVLRKFLREPSLNSNELNFKIFEIDTADWKNDEFWVDQISDSNFMQILWEYRVRGGDRIKEIYFKGSSKLSIKIDFDSIDYIDLISLDGLLNESIEISNIQNLEKLEINNLFFLKNLNVSNGTSSQELILNNIPSFESLSIPASLGLVDLSVSNANLLKTITFAPNNNLRNLKLSNLPISDINFSRNRGLVNIECTNNPNLTTIDVSRNPLLSELICSNNNLVRLTLGRITLNYLDCSYNQLTELNLGRSIRLNTLICNNNRLDSLDLSNSKLLSRLEVAGNELTALDLSKNSNLLVLDVRNNYFRIVDLNQFRLMDFPRYIATPQKNINLGVVNVGERIDLTSERIRGLSIIYLWEYFNGSSWVRFSTWPSPEGTYLTTRTDQGRLIRCGVNNPSLGYSITYEINVVAADDLVNPSLNGNIQLISRTPNMYSIFPNQTFSLNINSVNNNNNIRVGLFDLGDNTTLVSRVDISLIGTVYTCIIPSTVSPGSYVLQPYYERNGQIILVQRQNNSPHIIDKLPITVMGFGRGASISSFANVNNNIQYIDFTDHIYRLRNESSFKLLLPTILGSNVKVGLYNLNGTFRSELETQKEGSIYTLKVPTINLVAPGDYIVAPYEEVNGRRVLVSRSVGTYWIDRLPINISLISRTTPILSDLTDIGSNEVNSVSLGVYPNPVQDVLSIQGVGKVESMEIYTLSGRLIKKVNNVKDVPVQDLDKGMYILKAQTSSGVSTHKFIKK